MPRASRNASMVAASIAAVALLAGAVAAWAGGSAPTALPKAFPRGWAHVRSMAVPDPDHPMYGFHSVYADRKAEAALRKGVELPEGATLISSIHEVVSDRGVLKPGAKRRDVMRRKDRTAVETAGWRYAAFGPDGKPVEIDPVHDCMSCHGPAGTAAPAPAKR